MIWTLINSSMEIINGKLLWVCTYKNPVTDVTLTIAQKAMCAFTL